MKLATNEFNFWRWFFCRTNTTKRGCLQYFDRYTIIYVLVSTLGTLFIKKPLSEISSAIMLPMLGALIGITFAWSGNITALLSTKELDKLSNHVHGGLPSYIYYSQSTILIVFVTSIGWILAGLNLFTSGSYKFILFFLTAMCVRESWTIILLAQYLTLARKKISDLNSENEKI